MRATTPRWSPVARHLGPHVLTAALLCGACQCDPPGRRDAQRKPVRAPVVSVVDGDTIRVRHGGGVETVRYIGIDTPEWDHPRHGREPFAKEATEHNRRLVADRTVELRFGEERRDRYGRLLAYVYLPDGTFVNAELVERGLAEALTVPPNVRHAERLERLERRARRAGRGMWGR